MAEKGFQETADKALDDVSDSVASARDKFKGVADDVQSRYRKVSDDVRRGAERAQHEIRRGAAAARETYRDTAEQVRRGYNKVRKDATRMSRQVGDYVQENPGKSVLIAAGVGFLIGLIVRRATDDD